MTDSHDIVAGTAWDRELHFKSGPMTLRGGVANILAEEPAVAFHGWLDNANSFARLVPQLPSLRLAAVDFPGHGRSDHRPDGDFYHFVDYTYAVINALDALQYEKATLIGHSMGAAIAMLVAGTMPERVKRLILIDGMAPLPGSSQRAPEHLRSGIRDRLEKGDSDHRRYQSREEMKDRMQEANPMLTDHACLELLERGAVFHGSYWTFAHDLRLRNASLMRFREQDNRAFMSRVEAPTLLIRAEHGGLQDDELVSERAECFQNLEVVKVQGDHHLHLNSPEPVADVINEFLEKTG
jgi:pimeloyl-ACP methyl ester carboxylesterase